MKPDAVATFEQAIIAKRKEMYGEHWDKVDWWGIPYHTLPEDQRKEITQALKGKQS